MNGIGQCIDSFLTFDRLLRGAFGAAGFTFGFGQSMLNKGCHLNVPRFCLKKI